MWRLGTSRRADRFGSSIKMNMKIAFLRLRCGGKIMRMGQIGERRGLHWNVVRVLNGAHSFIFSSFSILKSGRLAWQNVIISALQIRSRVIECS